MMYEQQPEQNARWKTTQRAAQQEPQLEQRLHAYYGPARKEQPLAREAWQRLQQKLGPQQRLRKQIDWKHLFRRRGRQSVPEYVRAAFARVASEARLPHPLPALQCVFKPGTVPVVHIPLRPRPSMRLTLPLTIHTQIEGAVLDTLLATELARHQLRSRWSTRCLFVLCLSPALLSLVLLPFCRGLYLVLASVLMLILFLLSAALLSRLRRHLCLSGDALAVFWLGRERICQGLHSLVDYESVSSRRRWNGWNTPSLAERIERVCGTHSAIYDERLTLVR